MTELFSLHIPTHVRLGAGCRGEIPELLSRRGWKTAGLVVDHGLRQGPIAQTLIADIRAAASHVVLHWCDIAEPTYDSLDAARQQFDGRPIDVIVGIGGGSALDMAKAMAVLVNNREPAVCYRGFDKMTAPVLPIVAVPTTAGTGSEVTPNASFVDTREQRKLGINGEAVRPVAAFLDPELTLSCPHRPTLSAGIDSLVHATEASVARKSNHLARLFAREGFRRVFTSLPVVIGDLGNLEARGEVMFGAFLCGIALMHSGTGPAAAMSYPAGVHHRVPHGVGGGMFLPHVARYNVSSGVTEYAELYDVMPDADTRRSRDDKAHAFVERLSDCWRQLGVPRLAEFGVTPSHVDRFVADTLQLGGALEQNPVAFGEAEIRATISQAL